MTTEPSPARFKRTRVVLQDGEGVHPMLAISPSKDGGLIVDLCGYAPFDRYRYGVLDVPSGAGSVEAVLREHEASWATDRVTPKLHYHPSGFLSLDATDRLPRQSIQVAPPGDIGPGHKHAFTFIARHPFAWTKVARREKDLVFTPSQPPTTITIAGHLGSTSNLKLSVFPENPLAAIIESEEGKRIPTVVAQFETAQYYAWLELHPDREFQSGENPL